MAQQTVSAQAANAAAAPTQKAGRVLQRKCECGRHTGGGACGACDGRDRALRRRAAGTVNDTANVPGSVHEALGSPGGPPDTRTRSLMESRFGHDFSRVRVHPDARAASGSQAGNRERSGGGAGAGFPPRDETNPLSGGTNYVADTELITCMQIMGEGSRESCLQQIGQNPRPTGCVKGHPRTVSVQPVFFKSDAADIAPTGGSWASRFSTSNTIWGKLGVTFTQLAAVTLTDAHKTQGSNQAESQAIAALHSGAAVEVFVVDNDVTWRGGALTFFPLGPASKVVMSDRGTSNTLLAHELGHVLGLMHPGDGTPNDGAPRTVMQGSGSHSAANPTRNTMDNYRRMTWPGDPQLVCINPDI